MFLDCYAKISILIAVADIMLAVMSFRKNRTTGRFLGYACLGAAVVDISYLISILNNDYLCVSVMSSVYFANIDVMLLCLLVFTVYFTRGEFTKRGRIAFGLAVLYAAFEMIVFAINPFREIAVHYIRHDTLFTRYSYEMKPLYWLHLVFTYALVATVLVLMIRKLLRIPREYRAQYGYVVAGILGIVLVNAVFLYWPKESVYSMLDYSICGYSLTAFLLYWSCFNYSTHGMLNCLKTSIFENIGQGIVLFDYHDRLILHNERADDLLGGAQLEQNMRMEDFLRRCDLPMNPQETGDGLSLQCYVQEGGETRPLRCDIRPLRNDRRQRLGQLFVFSDAALETDLLTGFQDWESFQVFAKDRPNAFPYPTAVAVCDINGLSVTNSTRGNHVGDQQIRQLADIMRECFPKQTYYVRGVEAHLIALCGHGSEAEMLACIAKVKDRFPGKLQYAINTTEQGHTDILGTIHAAAKAMRTKKLLDREATHSEMLTSLIRALQECDSDTEHHVRRTQRMGAELGQRIELTDIQQSNLSLLCLLHDIGKIGIPLEILNKPGKLSAEEWDILRSHVRKGYDIARSNNELRDIAEEILHHHERWDGKGYPDGLSRESIPVLSRVIAVVDAYDAMTNNRSYRSAMSPARALEELKRCAGTQFDPFIVAEFLQMMKENRQEPEGEAADGPAGGTLEAMQAQAEQGEGADRACNVHQVPHTRYVLNEAMRIVSVDDSFEQLTGYSGADIASRPVYQLDLIPEENRTEYLCQTNAALARSPMVFQEHKLRRKDGSDIYVFCFGRLYYDSAVRAERSEILVADISKTYSMKMLMDAEQSKAQIRLQYWERTYRKDSLTGLLNHAAFRSDVELRLLEGKAKLLMLMMDVDRFKEYNDTYGHHNGDKHLILVAQTLLSSLRKEDRACRMGGDEFAAVLFFSYEADDALITERAQQIFDKLNMTLKGAEGGTGISMGAVIAREQTTFNELYEASDAALYEAKEKGRGRLVIR